jgi:hypothetical protein
MPAGLRVTRVRNPGHLPLPGVHRHAAGAGSTGDLLLGQESAPTESVRAVTLLRVGKAGVGGGSPLGRSARQPGKLPASGDKFVGLATCPATTEGDLGG